MDKEIDLLKILGTQKKVFSPHFPLVPIPNINL
jgi:hypothetical protein